MLEDVGDRERRGEREGGLVGADDKRGGAVRKGNRLWLRTDSVRGSELCRRRKGRTQRPGEVSRASSKRRCSSVARILSQCICGSVISTFTRERWRTGRPDVPPRRMC